MFSSGLEAYLGARACVQVPCVLKVHHFVCALLNPLNILGSAFGRTDFSRIFIFGPPDLFADFVAGFSFLILAGKSARKKCPEKSSRKIPDKILQILYDKNL